VARHLCTATVESISTIVNASADELMVLGGISLSPSFVVMFIMERYKLSWEEALQAVQNRRYCISPNGGFLTQIKEYESIYKANIQVKAHPVDAARVNSNTRRKRDDEEEDESPRCVFLILCCKSHGCRLTLAVSRGKGKRPAPSAQEEGADDEMAD
jgi:hypothetical protein